MERELWHVFKQQFVPGTGQIPKNLSPSLSGRSTERAERRGYSRSWGHSRGPGLTPLWNHDATLVLYNIHSNLCSKVLIKRKLTLCFRCRSFYLFLGVLLYSFVSSIRREVSLGSKSCRCINVTVCCGYNTRNQRTRPSWWRRLRKDVTDCTVRGSI